jgi:hypothetical protein
MNSLRTFQVCAKTDCTRFDRVGARVRAVKTKVAIYVDTLAPAGGLDSASLDSIADIFDRRLYGIDTAAFGQESDIDSNSVVLVLMTNTVNKLISASECNSASSPDSFSGQISTRHSAAIRAPTRARSSIRSWQTRRAR